MRRPTVAEAAMKAAGLDYADVGRRVQLAPRTVQQYCRRGCPHAVTGERLAKVIGVPMDFFCDGWKRSAMTTRAAEPTKRRPALTLVTFRAGRED